MDNKKELGEKKTITYKGKSVTTRVWRYVSEEERQKICALYYAKPDFDEVKLNFVQIQRGGTNSTNIQRYYVRELMEKTIVYHCRWCVEDILSSCDLLGVFLAKIERNTDVFEKNATIVRNLEVSFRLGGAGFATIPANFPIKAVDQVLSRFNVNNNWYDMSCGWGNRLLGALKNNVNYFGTDPNYLLVDKLNQMATDYKYTCGNYSTSTVDIKAQGSEVFVPEWENKMGLCFTSPPYFYLEDYQIGNQSYKEGTSYESWLENFIRPTIQNCKKYLIDNGYMGINIKDFDKFHLCDDIRQIATQEGFELVENFTLVNDKRINGLGELNDNDENIMIFMKRDFTNYYKPPIQFNNVWD